MTEPRDIIRCPGCGEPCADGAAQCRKCGASLRAGERAPTSAARPSPAGPGAGTAEVTSSALTRHASSLLDVGDLESTIPLYRRMVERDPNNTVALEQLEALYRSAARWTELVELWSFVAERATSPARLQELLGKMAAVYEQRLGDRPAAIDCLERVLALAPDDPTALAALARLRAE